MDGEVAREEGHKKARGAWVEEMDNASYCPHCFEEPVATIEIVSETHVEEPEFTGRYNYGEPEVSGETVPDVLRAIADRIEVDTDAE